MATPKQFAMQQVLNLLLRRPADKSIIAYLDNLKTSGLENTMEMTYPQGGRGNVYIGVGFAHSKRATLNIETATWNTSVMAVQNGTEVVTGDTEVIEYDVISYVAGKGFRTKFSAIGVSNEEIGFIYLLNADGTQGKVYTQTSTLDDTGANFIYSPETQRIVFSLEEQTALRASNAKICCAYKRLTTGDKAQKISLTGTSIPSVVLVTGYGVVMDICSNVAYLCQFNGKAQVDGNYTFDLSADGDPSVQSLNLEFVRDCGVKELYSFVIYDDDEEQGGDTPAPPTPAGYTIPFTIPTSMCEDAEVGEDLASVVIGQSAITNLENGRTYKLTLYDKNNVGYSTASVALDNEGLIYADFDFDTTTLPEDIKALFGTMSTATLALMNNYSIVAGVGDYFTLLIQAERGKVSADIQAVITKFYIEEA